MMPIKIAKDILDLDLNLTSPLRAQCITVPFNVAENALKKVESHRKTTIEQAPLLMALLGKQSSIFIGETFHFATSKEDENTITISENDPINIGIYFALKADLVPNKPGNRLLVDINFKYSHLNKPIKTEQPEVTTKQVNYQVELPEDHYACFTLPIADPKLQKKYLRVGYLTYKKITSSKQK